MIKKTGPVTPRRNILWSILITSCLFLVAGCHPNKPEETSGVPANPSMAQRPPTSSSDVQKQHEEAERQFRPDIESQRQQNQKEAEQGLDQDAIAAIQQTEEAVKDIAANKKSDALSAIEKATGKINVLLARNPATALIPVRAEVVLIDSAPTDVKTIDQIVQQAAATAKDKDLPAARVLLATLVSEIRIRTSSLPLATYPAALTQAARLLDQGKNQDAGKVLL